MDKFANCGNNFVTILPILYSFIFYIFSFFKQFHSAIAVLTHFHAFLSLCLIDGYFSIDCQKNSHIVKKWLIKLEIFRVYVLMNYEILFNVVKFYYFFYSKNQLANVFERCCFLSLSNGLQCFFDLLLLSFLIALPFPLVIFLFGDPNLLPSPSFSSISPTTLDP